MWSDLDGAGRRDLVAAIYERISVTSEGFVEARLTPEAIRHGMVLALRELVKASPAGVGDALTTCLISIDGRDEWLAAALARSA